MTTPVRSLGSFVDLSGSFQVFLIVFVSERVTHFTYLSYLLVSALSDRSFWVLFVSIFFLSVSAKFHISLLDKCFHVFHTDPFVAFRGLLEN